MFGTTLECGIKSVKVKVKNVQGREVRRCVVVLAHEFTHDIARALGEDALALLDLLRSNAVESAIVPIDGLAALGHFIARDSAVEIGRMAGIKAKCLKSSDGDEGPTIQLEFEFSWQEDAWLFLGRNCAAVASVTLTKHQLALGEDDGALQKAGAAFRQAAERLGARITVRTGDGKESVLADARKKKN